jgi:hypothetical protein
MGEHYVWCSECFDSAVSVSPWAPTGTSNPKDIYVRLRQAVDTGDKHDLEIPTRVTKLKGVAAQWHGDGRIDQDALEEIIYLVDTAERILWRPVLFVIPTTVVSGRCKLVPARDRAGIGLEWKIHDLKDHEFDVIELP